MDEQRILDEMERTLAADDPRLAARLAAFGQPSVGQMLRSRRARAAVSLMALGVIAAVAAVIYLVSAFRPGSIPHEQHSAQSATTSAVLPAAGSASTSAGSPGGSHCVVIAPRGCLAWSSTRTPPTRLSVRSAGQ